MDDPVRRSIPIRPASLLPAETPQAVSLYQKRQKVQARSIDGRFTRWRWAAVWATQLLFYGLPWLTWGDRPAVLFDLEARRFFVFGIVLLPQDLIYLAALLVIAALALCFFTAVAGRLWCGYACPQTVYTEIFMWIEHRTEGDRSARLRLDKSRWTLEKLTRRAGKHAGWGAVALLTGFSFVAYFVPAPELAASFARLEPSAWASFWVLFYAFATWGNAGFLREQICKYMCPYARFQGALVDADSLMVTYDAARGDPRGSRPRGVAPAGLGLGDCVDCTLCVQVCPTGIDIRNGLQNECIGCGACIDACDSVMDHLGYARGLVRYSTARAMSEGWSTRQAARRVLRPRVLVYGGVLLAATVALAASLATRSPFHVDVIKDRSTLARIVDAGSIENVYRLQVTQRSEVPGRFRVEAAGPPGLAVGAAALQVGAADRGSVVVSLRLPAEAAQALAGRSVPVTLRAVRADGTAVESASTFLVPR